MTIEQENISSSGFITSSFENISDSFTDFSEIPSQGFNQLFKAKRHGQWFVLKGLKPEYQQNTLYKELLSKEYDLGIQFKHPHIIQTFNKETRHPVVGPCLVMEYVHTERVSKTKSIAQKKAEDCTGNLVCTLLFSQLTDYPS